MNAVKSLDDIPLLFVEGEDKMGAPRKTRAELLDKVVQFIWDYQQKHDGSTPTMVLTERSTGIANGAGVYYMNMLIDEGRVDKISSRPFRVTINERNPDNKRAIDRWKRIQAAIERHNEQERDQIRERQETERQVEQVQENRQALFEVASTVPEQEPGAELKERSPELTPAQRDFVAGRLRIDHEQPEERPAIPMQVPDARIMQQFSEAQTRVREVNREVKAMMPKLLKIADERDLVLELVNRGYTVSKQR